MIRWSIHTDLWCERLHMGSRFARPPKGRVRYSHRRHFILYHQFLDSLENVRYLTTTTFSPSM